MSKPRTILAIDTSCDETSVAVVRGTVILSNIIASQAQLHAPYGGVFPTVAKQAHAENIAPAVAKALKMASIDWNEIDAIAVTQGPGLAPALEVGIRHAKMLAEKYQKPLLPVNHIEGHVLSVLAQPNSEKSSETSPQLPVLALVVSGGHTEFLLVEAFGSYQRLGQTIDDAAGEALDKFGRMVNLGYPAGPIVEKFAKLGDSSAYDFPLPMTTSGDFNLSFSGLKTFARNLIKKIKLDQNAPLTQQQIYDLCASFQTAVFRHITHKLTKLLEEIYQPDTGLPIAELWLGGGVAANVALRQTLRQTLKDFSSQKRLKKTISLKTPYTKKLCGDNAAMIGVVASLNKNLENDVNFEREPRLKI